MRMFGIRRKLFSCFAYISLTVFLAVLYLFIKMDKSSPDVIFDGPELLRYDGGGVNRNPKSMLIPSADNSKAMLVPSADFNTPVLRHPHLLQTPDKPNFNCAKLFANDHSEMRRAKSFLVSHNYTFTHRDDSVFNDLTQNCDTYKRQRDFQLKPASDQEKHFPVAYNILLYKNVDQFERLLQTIYAPQNQYCIHVDKKAPTHVLKSVQSIANCFDNVFVASKLEVVVYASFNRLQADINCMKDHLGRNTEWKYLLNMASSEFPIQTNFQLVQTLTVFNGANDIHEVFSTMDANRFKQRYITHWDNDSGYIINTNTLKDDPPHNLTITKGNAYNVFSRKFVEIAFQNQMAADLLEWSVETYTPDEHYWATLNNMYNNPFLHAPGGFEGHPDKKSFFGRYIGWKRRGISTRCSAGRYVHSICVFSVEDLPVISQRAELIANKFDIDYDPVAFSCMEEWIYNNTRDHVGISQRNERLYTKIAKRNE